jgi:quercetin dioxygenase-like cupin family protein
MVEIREGERITSDGEPAVTLLVDVEELGAVEVRSARSSVAPPLHAHARHAEALLVLEGELAIRLEDGERRAGPETWVYIPPEVVHALAVSAESTRFLDLHVPSSGFGDFVRGASPTFDQHPIPEYASADPGLVVIRRAGGAAGAEAGETIAGRSPNRRATLLVDADEMTVVEFAYGAGERGAAPHVHHTHADAFLVVGGEFTFHHRDGSVPAQAGTLLVFPPDVVHGFDSGSDADARCFNLHLPASGFADYLRGRNPAFDQHEPPPDGGVDPAAVVAVRLSG